MKNLLFIVSFLTFLTAGGVSLAQSVGNKYILDSLDKLLAIRTVECDLRVETMVNGKEYTARGQYAEQVLPQVTPNSFLRSMYRLNISFPLPLSSTIDSEANQMTLVCYVSDDGENFQVDRYISIEGVKSFNTFDMKRIEERLIKTEQEIFFSQVSEVRNLGGIASKMRQINRFYEFSQPTQESLQEEAVQTSKLTGTLKNRYLPDLLEQFGGLKNGQYPADFPSDIEVWLGLHNDFPYKIRYLRRTSENSKKRTMLFQETFYNVVLNGPAIPASKFTALPVPDDVFRQDKTDDFIRVLGL